MECQRVDEVVKESLELVRNKLKCQVASVFLFTKDGVIKRKGINGIDKEGNSIDNSWFLDEEYAPGASFSGKAIPTFDAESGFGEPQWSNDLINDFSTVQQTKILYLEKLGNLRSAISVPLNGRYRTFGTIEVINKLDDKKFSYNDVYWLILVANNVANFISDFIRKKEIDAFTEITQKLIYIEANEKNLHLQEQGIYNLVVEKITENYTPYKACIIRIANKSGVLEYNAKSSVSDVDWLNIQLDTKKADSGIARQVFKIKQPIFIENIYPNIDKFVNREFIKQNKFKSYVCIPLLVREQVFGTISVFVGCYHRFSINEEYFLTNIASLTAAIIARFRLIRDLQKIRQERDEARDQIFSAVRFARGDYFLQGVLHQYKNDLLDFYQILKTILDSNNISKIKQVVNNKISFIQDRVKTIQADSKSETITAININDVTKQVLQSFSELTDIEFISNFNSKIPIIEINEAKIKDIIFNLVSNAIKAIRETNNKTGKIFVSTKIITLKRIQYIQIMVEDNGIGIRNEWGKKIFEKGFTTSSEQGGTGMGLFVAREIINNYGGKINFESTVGKGTKFYIKIPLRRYLAS